MKITNVSVIPVVVPRADPSSSGLGSVFVVVARLRTDDGLEGLGHIMTSRAKLFRTLSVAVEDLGELLVGEDPRQPERLYRKMISTYDWFGPGGVPEFATCALDIAVWDLFGKAVGQPLYSLLGGSRDRVPAYASTRLGRHLSLSELAETATGLLEQGFRAMKVFVGGESTPEAEAARVRVVREAVGKDVKVMADATWSWTTSQAIRVGRRLEEFGLYWLEDPTHQDDLHGLAEISRALEIPIAAGERYFGVTTWRHALEAMSMDIPMVDLMRCGGVTPFRKVAALAEAFGKPVVNHFQFEVCAHLIAGVPNGLIVEHMPWSSPVFQGLPVLDKGELVLSQRPGHGLELDEAFVTKHRA